MKFVDFSELGDAVVTILPIRTFNVILNETATIGEILDLRKVVEIVFLDSWLIRVFHEELKGRNEINEL